jgi:hypothetical protein
MNYGKIYNLLESYDKLEIDVYSRLKNQFDAINDFLQKECCNNNIKLLLPQFKSICDGVLKIIDYVNLGKRHEANDLLYELYFSKELKKRLRIFELKRDTSLFRMRSAETYTQYTRRREAKNGEDEMFHLPYELRYKVDNERYSIAGLPVFYLSRSVYGCWEEIKRKNLDFSNVALFKNPKPLTFIDMTLPNENHTLHENSFLSLPLIFACRLKVAHPEGKFIPEYIIPQLLMECLIRKRDGNVINKDVIVGVKYESVYNSERDLLFTQRDHREIFINYAIPPFESHTTGICPIIKQIFKFWDCTSWAEINYRDPKIAENNNKSSYDNSVFGIIERRLQIKDPAVEKYSSWKGCLAMG